MNFFDKLNIELNPYNLLEHPFYQGMIAAALPLESLKTYAGQYWHYISAAPRYISTVHSMSSNLQIRQILLSRLIEEEKDNKAELWKNLAQKLGCENSIFEKPAQFCATRDLVEGFFKLTRASLPQGIGFLYVHNKQKEEVFDFTCQSLQKCAAINDPQTLKIFRANKGASSQNLAEIMQIIQDMSQEDKIQAYKGAIYSVKLLWRFLDDLSQEANL